MGSSAIVSPDAVAQRVAATRERIAEACERAGRDPHEIRMVGVTKGFDAGAVNALVANGIDDIAENRVQEANRKIPLVAADVRWHLIGHLQSNKIAKAAPIFDAVHSVDSIKTGRALGEHRPYEAEPCALLIQVDYTGSATRSGADPAEAAAIVRALAGAGGIHVIGLMTIAPQGDGGAARDAFSRLRTLRDELEQSTGWALPDLSMGMSDDFETAIEEGATMVRLGRVLLGDRLP